MKTSPDFLVATAERLGWALLHSLWQGAIIAVVLLIALRLLRRHGAAARHAVCLFGMIILTASVAATAWRVRPASAAARGALPLVASVARGEMNSQPALTLPAPVPGQTFPFEAASLPDRASSATGGVASSSIRSWPDTFERVLPWISAMWMIGVALLTLRHFVGWHRLCALRRGGRNARPELQRAFTRLLEKFGRTAGVRLLESADAAVPMLAGLFKPAVLLPLRVISGLREQEIEAILAHELAHLARRDAWSNLAQVAIETLLFYHPAIWWLGRCARQERENAADDLALDVCADRRIYAGALAQLAELRLDSQSALAATGGSLLARIQRIVSPKPTETPTSGWSLGIPAVLTALALAAIFRAQADDAKTINVAPGESIQAAIDAAPAGAIVRLGAGQWKERIVISKPLTLEGAGWEKSRITIEEPPSAEIGKAYAEGEAAAKAATTSDARDKATIELIRNARRPAIFVHSTDGVIVRNLRVQGISTAGGDTGLTVSTLVYFYNAKASMSDCVVAGPFGQGIRIGGGGNVEIRGSLIAAVWDNGISVVGPVADDPRPASRLHLVDSDVRNVYHYGIAIGRGCDSTVIERCRISGSAWHGIRYDDASPTITGNAIFQHARFGIYASGKTAATVRGNVLWKNEMEGMWCLSGNADIIEGNTFVGNVRGGIAVSGAKPNLARNIISGSPVAIACSKVSGRGGESAAGEPTIAANLFHDNPIVIQDMADKKSAPEGSFAGDPKFRDAAKQDFALAADSPARAANIGAATPLSFASPWPLLAEEKAIIPADDTRSSQFWTAPNAPKSSQAAEKAAIRATTDSKSWIADAFQLDDKAKREAAIERIRAAMTGGNVEDARTGVTAFVQLGPIEFDKASFRPAVRALLASKDPATRAAAASAFTMTGAEAEDLPRIFALADDPAPEVRDGLTYVIVSLTKHDVRDKAASDAILKLMANLPRDSRSVAHAMWGVKFSPEIEAKVIEFCRDIDHASNSSVGYNFFYGALSTQANKSEASCKRLIELLAHPDTTNIAGRSAWGLQQGVDRAQFAFVADAMVKVIEARSGSYLRNNALRCLRTYGNAAHAPALKALLAKPGATGDMRKDFEETLAAIEARPASHQFGLGAKADQAEGFAESPRAISPETLQNANTVVRAGSPAETPTIEVEWNGKWWPASVIEERDGKTQIHYVGYGKEWDEWVTKERIRPLTAAAKEPAANFAEEMSKRASAEALVEKNRQAARVRATEDRQRYSAEQLQEIETLYQVANTKGKRTAEARASLKQLLEKYDKANRTGCATLYLGQASEGAERLEYLTRAVEKFSDCYYFNGCQVGGYGRFVLALTLWDKGEKDKARALLAELKTTYKDATDHRGTPMSEVAEAVEKELAKKQGATGDLRKTPEEMAAVPEVRPAPVQLSLVPQTGEFEGFLSNRSQIATEPGTSDNQPNNPNDPEAMKLNTATLRNTAAALALATGVGTPEVSAEEAAALREKVAALEKRLSELEGSANSDRKVERLREENKLKARKRASEDRGHYKPEELSEIESLYQVANKNWRTEEALESLKKLLGKFDRANRTGCATLYMGQMSDGQDRVDYLTRAVEKFSDCYYLDGCQVGGYGRYVMALTLWEKGEKDKARTLLAELKTKYKDAIDHRGRPMSEIAEAVEKEFAAKQ